MEKSSQRAADFLCGPASCWARFFHTQTCSLSPSERVVSLIWQSAQMEVCSRPREPAQFCAGMRRVYGTLTRSLCARRTANSPSWRSAYPAPCICLPGVVSTASAAAARGWTAEPSNRSLHLTRWVSSRSLRGVNPHTSHGQGHDQAGRYLGSGVYLIELSTRTARFRQKTVLLR
jgi:hypothetical protein